MLYVMPPDGSSLTKLSPSFESWIWAAAADVIYGLDEKGVLYRAYPDGRESEAVMSLADRLNYGPDSHHWIGEASPDGRWLLVREQFRIEAVGATESDSGPLPMEYALWAVRTDGSDFRKLSGTESREGDVRGRVRSAKWTQDGAALYLAAYNDDEKSTSILRWRPSGASLIPVLASLTGHVTLLTRPDSDEIVIWKWRFGGPGKPWYQATEGAVLLLDDESRVRELASRATTAELATLYHPAGFDTNGRLVLSPRHERAEKQRIHALDLDSGNIEQIYP
jgi:hypothetical protein